MQSIVHVHSLAEWNHLLDTEHRVCVVDFTAQWCGPCKMIGPLFEDLSKKGELAESICFVKVDVDDASDVAEACGISAMPTFHAYYKKTKIDQFTGAMRDKLVALLERCSQYYYQQFSNAS